MTVDQYNRLRRLLGDQIPSGKTEDDAFFTNERLAELIESNHNIYGAASEGWDEKAAYYSETVDIMENGSDRKLSQLFRNAKAMSDKYDKQSEMLIVEGMADNRTVGVPFDIGEDSTLDENGLDPNFFPYPVSRGFGVL